MKNNKAITLIALIITIIILLILAGVLLSIAFGNGGLFENMEKSTFLQTMRQYQEELELYVAGEGLKNESLTKPSLNLGLEGENEVKLAIKSISGKYEKCILVRDSVMYYYYTEAYGSIKEVEWCLEAGIPVYGEEYKDKFDISAPITTGEYGTVNEGDLDGEYLCAPDLTGFNKDKTFYVLYDDDWNETIGNSLREGAPSNIKDWYNYASSVKKWANIVTIDSSESTGETRAYFVWIPRYAYKVDNTNQETEIRFINVDNTFKDFKTGATGTYNDTVPTYDSNGNQTNFCRPEAFWWDKNSNGVEDSGEQLPGIWVSKYEVSKIMSLEVTKLNYSVSGTDLRLSRVDTKSGGYTANSYEIYVDDELDGETDALPYTFTKIDTTQTDKDYKIKVVAKDTNSGAQTTFEDTYKIISSIQEFVFSSTNNSITIENAYAKSQFNVSTNSPTNCNVYVDGELVDENITFPHKINKTLSANTTYTIKITKGDQILEEVVKTQVADVQALTIPDLNGFELSKTYYVTYDANGENEQISTNHITVDANGVPNNIPSGRTWYNYENKIWANVVTISDNGKKAYFTWIPRYEYKLKTKLQETQIRFISTSDTLTSGYSIPEAFWWDNNSDENQDTGEILRGYWISKYEVSN